MHRQLLFSGYENLLVFSCWFWGPKSKSENVLVLFLWAAVALFCLNLCFNIWNSDQNLFLGFPRKRFWFRFLSFRPTCNPISATTNNTTFWRRNFRAHPHNPVYFIRKGTPSVLTHPLIFYKNSLKHFINTFIFTKTLIILIFL